MLRGLKDMSKDLMYTLIAKMHTKLNLLIESSNYNLLNSKVQAYSRILDRALIRYGRKH